MNILLDINRVGSSPREITSTLASNMEKLSSRGRNAGHPAPLTQSRTCGFLPPIGGIPRLYSFPRQLIPTQPDVNVSF